MKNHQKNKAKAEFIVFSFMVSHLFPMKMKLECLKRKPRSEPSSRKNCTQQGRNQNLGVMFNEYLSFDDHITSLCEKIPNLVFCINRIKIFANQDTLKTLYFAMVHSHLVYCINIDSCRNTTSVSISLWVPCSTSGSLSKVVATLVSDSSCAR